MPCDILTVNDTKYTVSRLLGKGKGGYSYLVTDGRAQYVLKQIHHEPCDIVQFGKGLKLDTRHMKFADETSEKLWGLLRRAQQTEREIMQYSTGFSYYGNYW